MHPASLATFSGTYNADNQTDGLAHDADGNMPAIPNMPAANSAFTQINHTATWDTRNRLVTLQSGVGFQPAFTATYTYDAEGNRISKTVNGQTTTWTVNPHGISKLSEVLVETVGTAKKFFVYSPTGLLYDVDSATTPNVRYYHADQVGSTVALTDASATVIGRAEYTAYGMVSRQEGDTATPFLYNGAYGVMTDAESGVLNMRARYYHPWMGRFVSEDPIGFEGGMNWYAYCAGDPLSHTDPSGTSMEEMLVGIKADRQLKSLPEPRGLNAAEKANASYAIDLIEKEGTYGSFSPILREKLSQGVFLPDSSLDENTLGVTSIWFPSKVKLNANMIQNAVPSNYAEVSRLAATMIHETIHQYQGATLPRKLFMELSIFCQFRSAKIKMTSGKNLLSCYRIKWAMMWKR